MTLRIQFSVRFCLHLTLICWAIPLVDTFFYPGMTSFYPPPGILEIWRHFSVRNFGMFSDELVQPKTIEICFIGFYIYSRFWKFQIYLRRTAIWDGCGTGRSPTGEIIKVLLREKSYAKKWKCFIKQTQTANRWWWLGSNPVFIYIMRFTFLLPTESTFRIDVGLVRGASIHFLFFFNHHFYFTSS